MSFDTGDLVDYHLHLSQNRRHLVCRARVISVIIPTERYKIRVVKSFRDKRYFVGRLLFSGSHFLAPAPALEQLARAAE